MKTSLLGEFFLISLHPHPWNGLLFFRSLDFF